MGLFLILQIIPSISTWIRLLCLMGKMFQLFRLTSEVKVKEIITNSPNKSCNLDPLLPWILKGKKHMYGSTLIIAIINSSIDVSVMPLCLKIATITPVSRDLGWISPIYRPIYKTFLSRQIEKVVERPTQEHLDRNDPHDSYQSAYRRGHSTETVLLKVIIKSEAHSLHK